MPHYAKMSVTVVIFCLFWLTRFITSIKYLES